MSNEVVGIVILFVYQLCRKGVTCSYIELLSKRDLIILQASGLLYEVVLWILGSVKISQIGTSTVYNTLAWFLKVVTHLLIALGGRSKLAWIIFKDSECDLSTPR